MDIIGYLRSGREEAKSCPRLKLMLVGNQGIGKTSLLEQIRQEGTSGFRRHAPRHWTRRMRHTARGNLKNQRGVNLSTVGVDIHDWVYQKKTGRSQQSFGPVFFSTWDFGGQEEFYATHRYFLSRRSIYLVVWRLTDGINGILGIQQWLVNIQSRAPNSPVIIVGTHGDMIEGGESNELVHRMKIELNKRFIDVCEHDKSGLPKVMDSFIVSSKTKLNIENLCNRIYDVAFSLRCPGSKERLLEQKVPSTYLQLEEIVNSIVQERHQQKLEPVLSYTEYKRLTSEQLKSRYNKTFCDLEPLNSREINYNSELQQATRFLHENGVLLHYEDSNLRDLYFLDPQWLCDILSHVVTIREINPLIKNGLMRIDELGSLFKSMDLNISGGVQSYVVSLLNKFEVALTWNSQYLLIPSLLPENPDAFGEQDFEIKLAPRLRGRSLARRNDLNRTALRSTSIDPSKKVPSRAANHLKNLYDFDYRPETLLTRFVMLRYLPDGFLARVQSGILSDPAYDETCEDIQLELCRQVLKEENESAEFLNLLGSRPSWTCWKKGIRLTLRRESTINAKADFDSLAPCLMTIQELTSSARELLLNQADLKVECWQSPVGPTELSGLRNTRWYDFDMSQYMNVIAITIHRPRLKITSRRGHSCRFIELSDSVVAKLLSRTVDCIDDLLEDWYPSLGARFAHTMGGNYLVSRIVLCPGCANSKTILSALGFSHFGKTQQRTSRYNQSKLADSSDLMTFPTDDEPDRLKNFHEVRNDRVVYSYYVEHCILNAYDLAPLNIRSQNRISTDTSHPLRQTFRARNLCCPKHGAIQISRIAPDIVFDDLSDVLKINNEHIERYKLIGRGALGFIFEGTLHSAIPFDQLGNMTQKVALKLLQPVDPGPEAGEADTAAYKSTLANWFREPFLCSCKSYCTARHEVNILRSISHPNIVSFMGLCLRPLAVVLELAPLGSLADVLRSYERASLRVDKFCVQKSILQVARALEFLHQHRIIYRDLKTENVLVWSFPSPNYKEQGGALVELKLADYGISRQALSTGIWKGFAGTLSYLAPEILLHDGDEEYTEKVDCFSFAMFLYELLTLRPPYQHTEGHGASGASGGFTCRSKISDGCRPSITSRDLIYPSAMVDLMTLCWSQEPHNRPTASQIVSLASTPEFMQIQTAATIESSRRPSISYATQSDDSIKVLLNVSDERLTIISASNGLWSDMEDLEPGLHPGFGPICSVCKVGSELWISDSSGMITAMRTPIQSSRSASEETSNEKISPSDNPITSADENDQEDRVVFSRSFQLRDHNGQLSQLQDLRDMIYVEHARVVVFLAHDGLLWTCDLSTMICEQLGDVSIKYNCITLPNQDCAYPTSSPTDMLGGANLRKMRSVHQDESGGPTVIRLFCGQSYGISLLEICAGEVRRQSILPLASVERSQSPEYIHGEQLEDTEGREISHILAAKDDANILWTAAGCTIHMWSVKTKRVIHKLDCWKLLPCSEGLESINIESYYQDARSSHVTSLVYMDEQLFVGTSHGCVIVIEASTLKPMTVFRPYESDVMITSPVSTSREEGEHLDVQQERYLVALGFGYRDIMSRYLNNCNPQRELRHLGELGPQKTMAYPSGELVAILLAPVSQYNL